MLRGGNWLLVLSIALLELAFFTPNRLKRRLGILAVSYAATLSYQGGVILLPLHLAALGSACVPVLATGRARAALGAAVDRSGLALGFLVNPYMNASGATFRFLWFHVAYMNFDPAGLYPGLREFGPVPLSYLPANPEFIVAPVLLLLAAGWVCFGALRRRPPSYAIAVLLGAALGGLVLTLRAIRMREYSVPWAVLFLALLAAQFRVRAALPLLRRLAAPLLGAFVCVLLLLKWPSTFDLLGEHLPSAQFAGALPVLRAQRGPPVLNIAEGDYTTLRWEDPEVAADAGPEPLFSVSQSPRVRRHHRAFAIRPARAVRLAALARFTSAASGSWPLQHRNSPSRCSSAIRARSTWPTGPHRRPSRGPLPFVAVRHRSHRARRRTARRGVRRCPESSRALKCEPRREHPVEPCEVQRAPWGAPRIDRESGRSQGWLSSSQPRAAARCK